MADYEQTDVATAVTDDDCARSETDRPFPVELVPLNGPPEVGLGGEVVATTVALTQRESGTVNTLRLLDNRIPTDASIARGQLLEQRGLQNALPMALDLAVTFKAKHSGAKMVAHEAAALHEVGMKALARAGVAMDNPSGAADALRLIGAATKCFSTCRDAMLALQQFQTGRRVGESAAPVALAQVALSIKH
jgi:hypothetical protein